MQMIRLFCVLVLALGLGTVGPGSFGNGSANANPAFWKHEWPNTDFEITSIENWREIMSGGAAKGRKSRHSARPSSLR